MGLSGSDFPAKTNPLSIAAGPHGDFGLASRQPLDGLDQATAHQYLYIPFLGE